MFEDGVTSVYSIALTTDVNVVVVSIDGSIGADACDNCVEVRVVVENVDDTVVVAASNGDPHITLIFPYKPPEIQVTGNIEF